MNQKAVRPVSVRGVVIGEGLPKICMPLVARDFEELQGEAEQAARLRPDLAEWRADYYEGLTEREVPGLLAALREKVRELPLLFTLRSHEEGGECPLPQGQRQGLMMAAAEGGADLLDAELSLGDALSSVLAHAHACHVPVVVSNHHFEGTPALPELLKILRQEQESGADIAKLAVMPHSPADVLALLQATLSMQQQFAEIPLITMSMGALGFPSRVCGGIFGSAVTFGAGERSSAPGQPGVEQLRAFIKEMGPPAE